MRRGYLCQSNEQVVFEKMYKIGDMIVYEGSCSVCMISDIAAFDFRGSDEGRLYYVLKPLHQDCVIYNPVDNAEALMRPIITKDEAQQLIDSIPEMDVVKTDLNTRRFQEAKQIAQHYEAIIKARDCASLIGLVMSIYSRKQSLAKQDRHIGSMEASTMKRAENMLFDELSVALDIPKEDVRQYIETRIQAKTEFSGVPTVSAAEGIEIPGI